MAGWAQPYLASMEAAVDQGFAGPECLQLYEVLPDVDAVLARLAALPSPGAGQPERV